MKAEILDAQQSSIGLKVIIVLCFTSFFTDLKLVLQLIQVL